MKEITYTVTMTILLAVVVSLLVANIWISRDLQRMREVEMEWKLRSHTDVRVHSNEHTCLYWDGDQIIDDCAPCYGERWASNIECYESHKPVPQVH